MLPFFFGTTIASECLKHIFMTTTASRNVFILNEHFYLPNLQRHRRLWIYLPEGYDQSEERFPVIYMHDGQNLFDESNSFGNEWGIDETLDENKGRMIVVGIDNGEEHRMAEYMLHDNEEHGAAEGALYLKDIAEAVKPYVDACVRTIPGREHTSVAGSSMGGLITLYAGIYMPQIFGSVGIFSPAFWLDAPGIFEEAKAAASQNQLPQRWYFYAGALESETMIAEAATMVTIFKEFPQYDVTYQLDSGGIHDENVWKNYFPFFYEWMAGNLRNREVEQAGDIKI